MNQSSKGAFISYSHADKEFVDRLVADLQRCDVNLWVDKRELKIGDSLMRRIRKGIDNADYFLVIISEHSVKSEWVQRELDVAMNDEILTGRIKVLPLVLDDTDLPGFLKGKVYADFSKNYQIALQEVLTAIGVQDSDIAVKMQNHPSLTEDTGSDDGYRNRDIHVLTELVSTFNTHAIDDFIDRGPANGIIPNAILDYYDLFSVFISSREFHIFDEQIKPVLKSFIDAWNACMGYDEFFFASGLHPFVKMQAPHEVDDPDRLRAARENFVADVTKFADAYISFIDYVHHHYPEIDLTETNQKAIEAIESKDKSQEQDESGKRELSADKLPKPKSRLPIPNITCGQLIAIIGIVIACLVLVFGNNIYQQITGHSIFQNPPTAPPTSTSTVAPTPTSTSAPTVTSTPTATPTITPIAYCIPDNVQSSCPDETEYMAIRNCGENEDRYCIDTIEFEEPITISNIKIQMNIGMHEDEGWGYSLWEVRAYGNISGNVNLLKGATTDVSSELDDYEFSKDNLVDDNMCTRWASNPRLEGTQWITISLDEPLKDVVKIEMEWQEAVAKEYCVYINPLPEEVIKVGNISDNSCGEPGTVANLNGNIDSFKFDGVVCELVDEKWTEEEWTKIANRKWEKPMQGNIVEFSPVNPDILLAGSSTGSVRVVNLSTGLIQHVESSQTGSSQITDIEFTSDGNFVLLSNLERSFQKRAIVGGLLEEKPLGEIVVSGRIIALDCYGNSNAALGLDNGDLVLIDVTTFTEVGVVHNVHGENVTIWDIVYGPQGNQIISVGSNNYAYIYQLTKDGSLMFPGMIPDSWHVSSSPGYMTSIDRINLEKGTAFAIGGPEGRIILYSKSDEGPQASSEEEGAVIWSLASSPDGRFLAAGTDSGHVFVYRVSDTPYYYLKRIATIPVSTGFLSDGYSPFIISLSFSSDNRFLAVGYAKGFKLFGPFK